MGGMEIEENNIFDRSPICSNRDSRRSGGSRKSPNVLVVSPSTLRFDATTHYWQAEFAAVVGYLRTRLPQAEINAEPAGLVGAPSRTVVQHLLGEPDFVLLWSRVWEAPDAKEIAKLVRELCPRARVFVWGDAPLFMPHYFGREPFDGAVLSGDPELVLADAIEALLAGREPGHGIALNTADDTHIIAPGRWLSPVEWPFPAPDVIPFEEYALARELRDKPTNDLSFDVSRGCPVGCAWCVDPLKGGRRDRRRPARATVAFMRASLGRYDQFQLHGPIFTQDRQWLTEFVREMRATGASVPFKAVTLVRHLADEGLVAELASVGLRAIGFGIETLTVRPGSTLTRKLPAEAEIEHVAEVLHRHGVEGKAYTQIGLAGQRREDVLYTHARMIELGFTVRATGATPFHLLRGLSVAELDALDLTLWDRKSFYDPGCGLSRREFFQLLLTPRSFRAAELLHEREAA